MAMRRVEGGVVRCCMAGVCLSRAFFVVVYTSEAQRSIVNISICFEEHSYHFLDVCHDSSEVRERAVNSPAATHYPPTILVL